MGLQVAISGSSVQTAAGPQSLLNDTQPLTKLDTTKNESFQTLQILFDHEPPQPDPTAGYSQTQIYQFAHTYTYVPRIWMNWQNPSPAYPAYPGNGGNATTFFNFGDDTANENVPDYGQTTALCLFAQVEYNNDPTYGTTTTTGFFFAKADETNITIYFDKVGGPTLGAYGPLYVIGETCDMRLYVFAEPATTSTY